MFVRLWESSSNPPHVWLVARPGDLALRAEECEIFDSRLHKDHETCVKLNGFVQVWQTTRRRIGEGRDGGSRDPSSYRAPHTKTSQGSVPALWCTGGGLKVQARQISLTARRETDVSKGARRPNKAPALHGFLTSQGPVVSIVSLGSRGSNNCDSVGSFVFSHSSFPLIFEPGRQRCGKLLFEPSSHLDPRQSQ